MLSITYNISYKDEINDRQFIFSLSPALPAQLASPGDFFGEAEGSSSNCLNCFHIQMEGFQLQKVWNFEHFFQTDQEKVRIEKKKKEKCIFYDN